MSWSFYGMGKPHAVAAKMKTELERNACVEPEEGFRQRAGALIIDALSAFPPTVVVTVQAGGSQSAKAEDGVANTLNLKIEPIYGFVE